MKTAEEYLKKHTEMVFTYSDLDSYKKVLSDAINEARRDAIEKCSTIASDIRTVRKILDLKDEIK